jgi:hypothetical protein
MTLPRQIISVEMTELSSKPCIKNCSGRGSALTALNAVTAVTALTAPTAVTAVTALTALTAITAVTAVTAFTIVSGFHTSRYSFAAFFFSIDLSLLSAVCTLPSPFFYLPCLLGLPSYRV